MNLPDNVLVFSEKILEIKLYQWQARINRLIEKCAAFESTVEQEWITS